MGLAQRTAFRSGEGPLPSVERRIATAADQASIEAYSTGICALVHRYSRLDRYSRVGGPESLAVWKVGYAMQYFPLLNFQHMVLAFCLGAAFVILLYIALSSYKRTREEPSQEELDRLEKGELAQVHDRETNPIASVLIFIYLAAIVWSISYVVVVGIKGVAF
jgi:hypothetical protein